MTLAHVVLPLVALAAGFVDAIAGGGGLLTLPALFSAGLDTRLVLGTNKGQAIFGSSTAFASFAFARKIHGRRALPAGAGAFLGALVGARLVLFVRPEILRPIVLGLLVVVAASFVLRGRGSAKQAPSAQRGWALARRHPEAFAAAIGGLLGLYDGFFGPGTGTFLIALYVWVFGDALTEASANAKVANFASNLGAFLLFAKASTIDFRIALPMGVAQVVGSFLGTRAAIRGGERVVRIGVLAVVTALVVRLVWQMS